MVQEELIKLDLSPHAKIYWLEDVKAVRVEWLQLFMSLDEFKSICGKAIEILQTGAGTIWIADSYRSKGVFSNDIQDFIAKELVPLAKSVGINQVHTVLPKESGLASMTTRKWQEGVKKTDEFIMQQFPDLASCIKWIQA